MVFWGNRTQWDIKVLIVSYFKGFQIHLYIILLSSLHRLKIVVASGINSVLYIDFQVLTICNRIMDDVIPTERANRDFRVKFPDDVMQENLAGQLWFGAEVSALLFH